MAPTVHQNPEAPPIPDLSSPPNPRDSVHISGDFGSIPLSSSAIDARILQIRREITCLQQEEYQLSCIRWGREHPGKYQVGTWVTFKQAYGTGQITSRHPGLSTWFYSIRIPDYFRRTGGLPQDMTFRDIDQSDITGTSPGPLSKISPGIRRYLTEGQTK